MEALVIPPSIELYSLDPLSLAQGAECQEGPGGLADCTRACGGAYASPDGTHMSLTVQVAIARLIIEAFNI